MSEVKRALSTNEETSSTKDFLTVFIADQVFGIPVLQVQDVLREQKVTKIPLAPPEVAGSLNLRGRIVTAIDVRKRLGLEKSENTNSMSVVVEHNHELFSLIIDRVGDVLSLKNSAFEKNPGTLDPVWRDISTGIYQLQDSLLVVMDVSKLLENINDDKKKAG
ncbi:MAG: chemotaxis protein CheW [Alphaproteobacteria bacterium]|nr:chemotaxis protein CheW [Alphaproteobacteria bacterium]